MLQLILICIHGFSNFNLQNQNLQFNSFWVIKILFVVGVVLSFEAIVIPTIRSILSKLVSQEEQGMA